MRPQPYGPFPYSAIVSRAPWRWPNGARLAVLVVPNVEFFALSDAIGTGEGSRAIPDVPQWSIRDYGNRIGIFRLMDVMDRYGIRGTVALNSDLCLHHPVIIAEGAKRAWEWMGHNQTNTRRLNSVPAEEEAEIVRSSIATIADATGRAPAGWLSSGLQQTWNTLEHLADAGIRYVCDWVNDDQPYAMQLDAGRRMISVPYSLEINDKPAYERRNHTPTEFGAMIRRQFDILYAEGAVSARVMTIALHPYLSGVPHRIAPLDAALQYIASHDRVWFATGAEVAEAYQAAHA